MTAMHHAAFALLTEAEQVARVRRLVAARWSDHDVARLVGWRVETVRQVLAAAAAGQRELPLPVSESEGRA